ncbi:MAG: L-ribulose-5-phosphate 4-epimerase AraD [Phycisphaerae bacterium]|nr:L-ribulose-5-phosphate 4-epimerase AraD [Phycisphaerae bacterium]
MSDTLKEAVCTANLKLAASGLVIDTWGNVSGVDRAAGVMVIKASGVPYEGMTAEHMVAVRLDTGKPLDTHLKPSSDTPTHLALYRALPQVGGVVHTHSVYATAWAQARRAIPALGTTHADYFHGPIPCTRELTAAEIRTDYEANTGAVILEVLAGRDALEVPAALVAGHGPFAWGGSPDEAVHNAILLEHLARMAALTTLIAPKPRPITRELLDKHFFRKHGPGHTYGQD